MHEVIQSLFQANNFMPHGSCFLWDPKLLWLFVISDGTIVLSYFSIPIALSYFVYRRKDLEYKWVFVLFSLFILLCGATHLLSIVTIWHPIYAFAGVVKALTAIVSFITAILIWPLIPKALSIPSPMHLLAANQKLEQEVEFHRETKQELCQLNKDLDHLVSLRTIELQKLNEDLKNSEQRFKQVLNISPAVILTLEAVATPYQILFISDSISTLTGFSPCEWYANKQLLLENIHPDDKDQLLRNWSNLSESNPVSNQFRFKKNDDNYCWIQENLILSTEPITNKTSISGAWVDISYNKSIEERLRLTMEEAKNANLAKSQFLASMSHELRTPLNSILGFAQLLEQDVETQDQQDSVSHILSSGKHLLTLINGVLDLSKIERGIEDLSIQAINIKDIMEELINLVQNQADQANIRLDYQNIEQQPEVQLLADPVKIRQVILNLLSNAIKYNCINGKIIISSNKTDTGKLRISIQDTGEGLSETQINNLFIPFNRLGKESSNIEGTGIGLTICKRLVELMDGEIGVDSRVGEGSCFWVEFNCSNDNHRDK